MAALGLCADPVPGPKSALPPNRTRGGFASTCPSAPDADITMFNRRMRSARRYEDADVFRFSFARLPFGERKDVGNFTALVSPGIDRPELVGLAILDHGRVVRTLGE